MSHQHPAILNLNPAFKAGGFSLVELLVYVAIVGLSAVFIANQFGNLSAGSAIERAYTEIEKVRGAAVNYRNSPKRSASYADISITQLSEQGYNVRPLSDGTDENTYGLSVTIAPGSSGATAILTYATDTASSCKQLLERYSGSYGIKGDPTCTDAGVVTITLE